jgi:hypothetical protein
MPIIVFTIFLIVAKLAGWIVCSWLVVFAPALVILLLLILSSL